jgi:hypothetical protein
MGMNRKDIEGHNFEVAGGATFRDHRTCGVASILTHFESLKGDRDGQFSIRINQQWWLCFEWPEGTEHPFSIEVVDYH